MNMILQRIFNNLESVLHDPSIYSQAGITHETSAVMDRMRY